MPITYPKACPACKAKFNGDPTTIESLAIVAGTKLVIHGNNGSVLRRQSFVPEANQLRCSSCKQEIVSEFKSDLNTGNPTSVKED